jgi:hypothetical protein
MDPDGEGEGMGDVREGGREGEGRRWRRHVDYHMETSKMD